MDPAPESTHATDDQVARSFLEKRGGEILKNVQVAKVRKTLSKVVSGKAITEDNVTDKIKTHIESSKPINRKKTIINNKCKSPKGKSKKKSNPSGPSQGTSGTSKKTNNKQFNISEDCSSSDESVTG